MKSSSSKKISEAYKWYRLRLIVLWLDFSDWLFGRSVTGDLAVTVSLTTHGKRLATVHTSIQSIVTGNIRPSRMILWLNGEPDAVEMGPRLKRLQRRGLEIKYVENFGPHTKYYPYVVASEKHQVPLVTADDDVIYPKDWLEALLMAHQSDPELIHCYWARKIAFEDGCIKPYLDWSNVNSCEASVLNFALGVSGVIYPPKFLSAVRSAGDEFLERCPKSDDIWLHLMALRSGYRIQQVRAMHAYPLLVPFTQDSALYHENHRPEGNDAQIAATYSKTDLDFLARHASGN